MRFWPFSLFAEKAAEKSREMDVYLQKIASIAARVNSLPMEEASSTALAALRTNPLFATEPATGGDPLPQEMPDSLKAVFSTYKMIFVNSTAVIDVANWQVSGDLGEPYYFVGQQSEMPIMCDVNTGEFHNYEGGTSFTATYPSVFHWLLYLAEEETVEP